MKHTKTLALAAAPLVGAGLLIAGIASAHGPLGFGFGPAATPDEIASRETSMFQEQANLLGLSVDDVKNAWAKGETLQQLAQDHGITADQLRQKMQDAATARMKSRLQTLVDKGVITQAQMDQRVQFLANRTPYRTGGMGMGRMHGFGF